jgi:signal transduction histidine kinase
VSVTETTSRLDRWEGRELPVYRALPYVLLAVSVLVTLAEHPRIWPYLTGTLIIAGVSALWICAFVTVRPETVDRKPFAFVYFAGLLVLAAALVAPAPWFGIFAWSLYLHAVMVLPGRWKYAGIIATAGVMSVSQMGGLHPLTPDTVVGYLVFFAINAVVATTMCFFALVGMQQGAHRKQMLAELAETNAKLQATMEENSGLHTQLLTQAREAGVLDERQRMAREIHDTLAQGLTGIITQLEAARQAAPPARGEASAEWQRHLDTASQLARESLSEARRSVYAVRPEALEVARLPEALSDVVARWSAVNGVAAEVTTTGTARALHPEVEVALLRIAQEGLANVAKHASASRVGLTLSYMEDVVTLDVRDDGVGFEVASAPDTAADPRGGFGLVAMRQRVQRLAGRLAIESERGGGTAISASVPAIAGGGG